MRMKQPQKHNKQKDKRTKIIDLFSSGKYTDVISICNQQPQQAEDVFYMTYLALSYVRLDNFSAAEVPLRKLVRANPNDHKMRHLLGAVLTSQCKFEEALELLVKVYNETQSNAVLTEISKNLLQSGLFEQAYDVCENLLKIEPENHHALFNASLLDIYFGKLEQAGLRYERRVQHPDWGRHILSVAPNWQHGSSLQQKRVLVWSEQGIGDSLFFLSALPHLVKEAFSVTVICEQRLQSLLEFNNPGITTISKERALSGAVNFSDIDVQILAGSLWMYYSKAIEDFKRNISITVPDSLSLPIDGKTKIGVSWFHGKKNIHDRFAIPLLELVTTLNREDIEWYNLQYGYAEEEVKQVEDALGVKLLNIEGYAAAGDFSHYGQLINQMDLVITADNAAFIFSMLLGKTTILLSPIPHLMLGHDQILNPHPDKIFQFINSSQADWPETFSLLKEGLSF